MRSQVQIPEERLADYFANTRADINVSQNLGLIDKLEIAEALSQKIQNVQDATTRGQIRAAMNMLGAFKNHVNAQAGKHITGIAVHILRADADTLLSQLSQRVP